MTTSLETINLPHIPSLPVHIALYRDVQNAASLKGQLLAGQKEFEYAFIDASMVCLCVLNKNKVIRRLITTNRYCQGLMSLPQYSEQLMITCTVD